MKKKKEDLQVPETVEVPALEGQEEVVVPDEQAMGQINPLFVPQFFDVLRDNVFNANRIIWITSEIAYPSVQMVIQKLAYYNDGTKNPIIIMLNSPGGCCDVGWAIIDMMEALKKAGVIIYTVCLGSCSSMATEILAAGSKGYRYAYPSSRIMMHQAGTYGIGGKLKELSNEVKEIEYWTELSVKYLQKVTGKSHKEIAEAMSYDNYMSSSEARKFGLVDKVSAFMP